MTGNAETTGFQLAIWRGWILTNVWTENGSGKVKRHTDSFYGDIYFFYEIPLKIQTDLA